MCTLQVAKIQARFLGSQARKNRLRDLENQTKLRELGWDVLVVWECEVYEAAGLPGRIMSFLENW